MIERNRLQILYDISVLGASMVNQTARTGVFRYVKNIYNGLMNDTYLNLLPFSLKQHYKQSLKFLKTEKQFGFFKRPSLFDEKSYSTINKNCMQLFHSPYLAIPEEISKNRNLKKVLTVYDLIPLLFPEYFNKEQVDAYKKILSSIKPETKIICISESTKSDLCNHIKHINPDDVAVTYLGASSLFQRVRSEERIQKVRKKYRIPDGQYILSLSTLEPRKNTAFTIDAFIMLVQENNIKDLNLVLVGTRGWKYDEIFDKINKHSYLASRIIITGYVKDEDLAPLYSGAMCFVYPSKYEGFGLPTLEAMQCEIPVITSDNSSLPEVVGNAGVLIDISKPENLTVKMLELYSDNNRWHVFSKRSIEQAKKFSWERCVNETIQFYNKAFYK